MTRNDEFIGKRLGGATSVWNQLQYDRDGIIEASAGTGKTYALQSIVLKLVSDREHPVDVRNILLVTFTEKAAGELKDRIRDILDKAGVLPADFDETTICTIHSFCRELLSEYAFENRVPMQMDIGGSNADLVHRAVREALLGKEFREKYGPELFEAYMEAGGMEKTDALAAAAEAVLENAAKVDQEPTPPEPVDAESLSVLSNASSVSFDFEGINVHARSREDFENACAEIKAAIPDLSSKDLPTWILAVARHAGRCQKLNPSVTGHGRGVRMFNLRPDLQAFAAAMENAWNALSAHLANDLACLAWPVFRRLKDESAMMTFDDLVTQACRVIEKEAEREASGTRSALMDSIRRRYRIALVDEFQDTDLQQWTIFGKLFSSRVNQLAGDGVPEPAQGFLLVVGDPKQAIYGFRGADVATYLAAKREIAGRGQPPATLDATFRSSKTLVGAFNKMFGAESGWFEGMGTEDARIEYFDVLYPEGNEKFLNLEDLTGRAAVTLLESLPAQLPDILDNRGSRGYGNTSMCLPVFMENAAREMKRIRALPAAYTTTAPDTGGTISHQIRYGDMCVLVRGGGEANVVKRVLAGHGIPYSHYKERGIYESVEAEALIAFFDFLSNPAHAGNLAALLLTPLFNIHPSELEAKLENNGRELSDLIEKWQELAGEREWNTLFESVMMDTTLAHPARDDYEFDRRWTAMRQMLDRLLAEKGRSALKPGEFAEMLRAWRNDDQRAGENGALRQKENDGDSVQIMTMHASKGLEFKAVFIAAGFGKITDDSLDEEKRLYYVALTRAEHKLYLPWTQWDSHLRKGETEFGLGSVSSPLLGEGYLSKAIRTYFDKPGAATVSLAGGADASAIQGGEPDAPEPAPPRIYRVGYLKNRRLQWDSYSSLGGHKAAGKVVSSADGENGEQATGRAAARARKPTLLPRDNVSGDAFHTVMETLCGNDEATGAAGFAIGRKSLDAALADDGPLMDVVRRAMWKHSLANRKNGGDSTERTLARMAWHALNTPIDFDGRAILLKDIPFGDRRAEVEFVIDERSVLGADTPYLGGALRDGAFNGKIDLMVRPDGRDGRVLILDWKTNSLADYGAADVENAMAAAGYLLQFKLYSLAVVQWLGRTALAGVAYLFVRGCEDEGRNGVFKMKIDDAALADCRQSVLDAIPKGRPGEETGNGNI